MSRDSFVKGAFILAAGSLISRGLGAVYRIFLPFVVGGGDPASEAAKQAMGLFGMAYPIYTIILSISAVGLPLAISKLVSEHTARGEVQSARRVFRVALVMLALLGLLLSGILYAVAPYYARYVSQDVRATLSIQAIAGAVFFVSIMSAFRGYFQGLQVMTPHAASQVIEQLVRIGTMFLFAWLLLPFGIEFAAAGATFGAVTGAMAGLLYLVYVYLRVGRGLLQQVEAVPEKPEKVRTILKRVVDLAVPISLASMILPLMNFLDSALVPARLHVAGFVTEEATALYGILTQYAMPFMVAPTVFTAALSMSLLPSISEGAARGNWALVRSRASQGIRIAILIGLPASAGLFVLARPIPAMFGFPVQVGTPLAILASGVLFMGLQQTSSGVLQGLGRPLVPMRNLLLGAAAKVVITWVFTAIPTIHVNGAATGTAVAFLLSSALNLRAVEHYTGSEIRWFEMTLRPALAVLLMSLSVVGGYALLLPEIGQKLATLAAVGIGVVGYGAALLLVGGVTARELELIPRVGPRMVRTLQNLGWLRG